MVTHIIVESVTAGWFAEFPIDLTPTLVVVGAPPLAVISLISK